MSHVHVIGAGLAGLSASLALTQAGRTVTLYEAGSAAGGRCRSYFDKDLDLRIDNGNHLLLSGNRATFGYIATIGSLGRFHTPGRAIFPFYDSKTKERWTVRLNRGRLPWWVMFPHRRVPDTRLSDYLAIPAIARLKDVTTVANSMRRGRLYWRMVEPLAVAALNTRPQIALASLLGAVLKQTVLRGGKACIPWFPQGGLSEALIDPAIETLRQRGAHVHLNRRVTGLSRENGRVTAFSTTGGPVSLAEGDAVIFAAPPWAAAELLPEITAPDEFETILNIHFRVDPGRNGPGEEAGFVGLLDATAEWVFVKEGHVSVTISAANSLAEEPARTLAAMVWPDVRAALELPDHTGQPIPPFRVIKEKRATFAATAAQEKRRPQVRTAYSNLVLAGDWTATGLPATIEGAIRSGETAALAVLTSPTDGTHGARRNRPGLFRPE